MNALTERKTKLEFNEKHFGRFVSAILVMLFVLSMIPIVYCGFFDYANGDDLISGATSHRMIVEGTDLFSYLKAVFASIGEEYRTWGGNWSSAFMKYALQPSIFSEKAYVIVPFCGYFFVCFCTAYMVTYFMKKYISIKKYYIGIVCSMLLILMIQFAPYIRPLLFWWVGMVVYIFPWGLLCLTAVWLDKLVETEKKKYFILSLLASTYISGAGYFTAVLTFEILVILLILMIAKKRRCLTWYVAILLLLFTVGLFISVLAPGNAARAVAENTSIDFSFQKAIGMIGQCVMIGTKEFILRLISIRLLCVFLFLNCVFTWVFLDVNNSRLSFKYPWLVILMYLIYCSTYAPWVYANSEVSGGGPDNIFFVFLLLLFCADVYLTGFFKRICIEKNRLSFLTNSHHAVNWLGIPVFALSVLIFVFGLRHFVGNSSWYLCKEYIDSGALDDYVEQMSQRLAILESDEKVVVLPEMNSDQGPFMHMPLVADPAAFTNYATSLFYGKESVIAIPRDEWNEKYQKE